MESSTPQATNQADVPNQVSEGEPSNAMSGAVQSPDATADINNKPEDTNTKDEKPDPSDPTTSKETEDVEMKDAEEHDAPATGPDEAEPEPALNGTPASSKKSNGKRNRGVPEHKTKKLNKKKSSLKQTHLDAKPGEYFFARLKSYPPWPSIICDEEMLPTSLLSTRPVTTMQIDGSYKEPYADGGKRVNERTFPVMFLHTNEFAWIPNTDLTPLNTEECKDIQEKGKAKSLYQAYQVAAENHDLQHFKDMLINHQKAMQEDQERKEARQAAKVAKAEKKSKRKSTEGEDEMDLDEEEKPKSAKKRKKAVDSDGENEKPTKTPKTGTKLKLTTPKAPESAKRNPKTKSPKKEPEPAKEEELTPEQALQKKEKEVLFLRHKLQKGFLSRDQPPQEDEMPAMSNFVKKLEEYGDLEVSIIRGTKINKVLKAMIKLDSIPKDEEFHFRDRSLDLLNKWNKLLGTEVTEKPVANGVHHEEGKEESKEDTKGDTKEDNGEDKNEKDDKTEEELREKAEEKMEIAEEETTTAEADDAAVA